MKNGVPLARREIITLTDDLDGSNATQTVRFGLNGIEYEIDLSDANAAELTTWLENYVAHGRRVGGRKKAGAARPSAASDPSAVRAWARENGIEVNKRGRISANLSAQFLAATA